MIATLGCTHEYRIPEMVSTQKLIFDEKSIFTQAIMQEALRVDVQNCFVQKVVKSVFLTTRLACIDFGSLCKT